MHTQLTAEEAQRRRRNKKIFGVVFVMFILGGIVDACGGNDSSDPEPKAAASSKPAKPKPSAAPSKISQADLDKALEAAGLPATPKAAQRQAFLKGLNAIDTDIVHGKDDKAVSRGMDTCGLLKRFPGDETKQIDQTNQRWSSPTHPEGHGLAKAAKILDVAHKNICPDF
ncbi:hypothetical protein [Streptomyces rhizosphaerihabitans]|uniref:hypothetical protein n=1 Tax=Streptomyces rhizosphaerihabitans TaxID=1266770 RepID=UPI0021BDF655|nr:hypothetical protein [Streptomyces rhizosphaerihabitans]MCT9010011.1 hypothetical protein [Streptomyces rhizosphaerihabitans]